jgi:hypothetical protein
MRKLVLSALILSAYPLVSMGAVEGQWTYIVENGGATITASTATGDVTIPSVLGGYAVKKVGNGWPSMFGNTSTYEARVVSSVVIPNGVTSIGEVAFYGCTSLYSISLPNSLTSIGNDAFYKCNFSSISIPNSVTSIGDNAFDNCTRLAIVTIGNSVTSIGMYAFYGCTRLASITIPNSVTSIGIDAFNGCTRLGLVTLSGRFSTTYPNFGLTASQVSFYDTTSPSYLMGQQSVIANPSTYGLYTTSQIQNMAVGDLVLTRQESGGFVLNYDIEQSTDLQTWTPYQALSLPLTGLPTDKAFVRIKAK